MAAGKYDSEYVLIRMAVWTKEMPRNPYRMTRDSAAKRKAESDRGFAMIGAALAEMNRRVGGV